MTSGSQGCNPVAPGLYTYAPQESAPGHGVTRQPVALRVQSMPALYPSPGRKSGTIKVCTVKTKDILWMLQAPFSLSSMLKLQSNHNSAQITGQHVFIRFTPVSTSTCPELKLQKPHFQNFSSQYPLFPINTAITIQLNPAPLSAQKHSERVRGCTYRKANVYVILF